jgi:hypothetical protein
MITVAEGGFKCLLLWQAAGNPGSSWGRDYADSLRLSNGSEFPLLASLRGPLNGDSATSRTCVSNWDAWALLLQALNVDDSDGGAYSRQPVLSVDDRSVVLEKVLPNMHGE